MRKLFAASAAATIAALAVSSGAAFAQVSQPPYGNVSGYLTPSQPPQSQMAQASAAFTASASYNSTSTASTSASSSTSSAGTTTATTTYQAPPASPNASVTATENARLNGNAPYAPRSATAVSAPGKKAVAHVATSSKKVASTAAASIATTSQTIHDLVITRNDVNLGGSTTAALSNPAKVRTDADLSAFAQGIVASDPNVQEVEAADDHVTLSYSVPGRFLGIVPTKVQAEAAVDATGNAKLTYPWYDFLVTVDDSAAKANLQSGVDAATQGSLTVSSAASSTAPGAPNTGGNMWASSTLSASSSTVPSGARLSDQSKAMLLATLHSSLQNWVQGQGGASANASSTPSAY